MVEIHLPKDQDIHKKYDIWNQRPRETATIEQLSMLNELKTKTNDEKAITKYDKFVRSSLQILTTYKDFKTVWRWWETWEVLE